MPRKKKVSFDYIKNTEAICMHSNVKITKMNHIVEVLHISNANNPLSNFKKLDKEHYMDINTGEVHTYWLNENRGQNIAGIKKTIKRLRNIINANFTGAKNELFITLTYRYSDGKPMTDAKRLYVDFDRFMKRLKRKYDDIDYLCIVEPQGSGAWHCHVLVRFNGRDSIYISNNDVIAPMWGHGFTKTIGMTKTDNIGAYFSAYLADMDVSEENIHAIMKLNADGELSKLQMNEKEVEQDGHKQTKKFIKGARLYFYPSGLNMYRASRGIKKPEVEEMTYSEAKKIIGSRTADYRTTICITDSEDSKILNKITYEQYNLLRNKNQHTEKND